MGWKLAVVISPFGGRDLQSFVDEIYGRPQPLTPCDLRAGRAFFPTEHKRGEFYALSHEGFGWIFDWKTIERTFQVPLPTRMPTWTFALHSVVNGYGFSAQRDGAIVRARSGSSDGIDINFGTPSAAERALVGACGKSGQEALAWETWLDDSKSFDGAYEGITHDLIGEPVVFGLINELVGFRIDEESPATSAFEDAPVARSRRASIWSLFSPFRR
jgi:hypothetical protein